MKPVDICALKPVTVALPQRILTAFPFHPNCELFVCSSGTGDALFNYMKGYVAESAESNEGQSTRNVMNVQQAEFF